VRRIELNNASTNHSASALATNLSGFSLARTGGIMGRGPAPRQPLQSAPGRPCRKAARRRKCIEAEKVCYCDSAEMPQLGPSVDLHGPDQRHGRKSERADSPQYLAGMLMQDHSLPGAGLRASMSNASRPWGLRAVLSLHIVWRTLGTCAIGCRPERGWNSVWRIPGDMKLSFQAARSIG
jgi:hypothetical protein